jgi:hypothetical protein
VCTGTRWPPVQRPVCIQTPPLNTTAPCSTGALQTSFPFRQHVICFLLSWKGLCHHMARRNFSNTSHMAVHRSSSAVQLHAGPTFSSETRKRTLCIADSGKLISPKFCPQCDTVRKCKQWYSQGGRSFHSSRSTTQPFITVHSVYTQWKLKYNKNQLLLNQKIVEPYIDVLVFLPLMMANMLAETSLVYDQ